MNNSSQPNGNKKRKNEAPEARSRKRRRSNRKTKGGVPGVAALGTNRQGPQQLKTEQFATYAPLSTFDVSKGSTPGGIRVRGRELIQSLPSGSSSTGGFGGNNGVTAGGINLIPSVFPRLSAYTSIYEFYKFHWAKAIFQSTRPTTAQGVAELAVDYDSKDGNPTSTVGMMRNITSCMSNIYADCACVISGGLSRLPKYATSQTASPDIAQTVQANVYYAFEGLASTEVNTSQGYLIVEYDVEFFTPQ